MINFIHSTSACSSIGRTQRRSARGGQPVGHLPPLQHPVAAAQPVPAGRVPRGAPGAGGGALQPRQDACLAGAVDTGGGGGVLEFWQAWREGKVDGLLLDDGIPRNVKGLFVVDF